MTRKLYLMCSENNKIITQNPSPLYLDFVDPSFGFLMKTSDITQQEITYVKSSVTSLVNTNIQINGKAFSVRHIFTLTMIDGKVCKASTLTKSRNTCYV